MRGLSFNTTRERPRGSGRGKGVRFLRLTVDIRTDGNVEIELAEGREVPSPFWLDSKGWPGLLEALAQRPSTLQRCSHLAQ